MPEEKNEHKSSVWAEFYIEFLGSLVPGLFALILSVIVLGLSLVVLCRSLQPAIPAAPSVVASATTTTTAPAASSGVIPHGIDLGLGAYGVTGILLVAAYVLGSIFYRQDPKVPDWRSASRVYKRVAAHERERLAVQPTSKVPEGHDTIHLNDAQFPYFFLYEYLKGRGLDHLAEWVPWQGQNPESWKYRTKMFINQIKIRLQFLVPEHCKDIVRNEAHVRLATSVWYATRWIMGISALGLLMLASALWRVPMTGFDQLLSGALCANVLILAFAIFIKRQVENFIHYLRVREVVYVLETAHFATQNGLELHREDFDPRRKGTGTPAGQTLPATASAPSH